MTQKTIRQEGVEKDRCRERDEEEREDQSSGKIKRWTLGQSFLVIYFKQEYSEDRSAFYVRRRKKPG